MARTHGERMEFTALNGATPVVDNCHNWRARESRRTFPNNISGVVTTGNQHIRGSRVVTTITADYYGDFSVIRTLVDADITITLKPDSTSNVSGTCTTSLVNKEFGADKEGGECGGSVEFEVNGIITWSS